MKLENIGQLASALAVLASLLFILYLFLRLLFIKDKKRNEPRPGRGGGDHQYHDFDYPPPVVGAKEQAPVKLVEPRAIFQQPRVNAEAARLAAEIMGWTKPDSSNPRYAHPTELPQTPIEWNAFVQENFRRED